MLGVMVGLDPKDGCAVYWFCWCRCFSRYVPFADDRLVSLLFGRYGPEGQVCCVVETPPRSSRGRARRRHSQWRCPGCVCWFRAVFPFVVLRPKMRGILFGVDQKDSFTVRSWPLRRAPGIWQSRPTASPEEYRNMWIFWEMRLRYVSVYSAQLGPAFGYTHMRQSTVAFGSFPRFFFFFLRDVDSGS